MAKRKYPVVTTAADGKETCLIFQTHKAAKDYVQTHPMERAKLVGTKKREEVRRHG